MNAMKSPARSHVRKPNTMTLCAAAVIGACLTWTPSFAAEPRFAELPDACGYLTEQLASGWLRAKVRPGPANEHIPTFWSQCVYSGQGVRGRQVGFVFKFMLFELFDVEKLDTDQLRFNATFVAGGTPPLEMLDAPGKIAFTFEKKDQSILLMVTGIQGPPDGAGTATEFVAMYHLSDPDTPHAERIERLIGEARRHIEEWRARADAG